MSTLSWVSLYKHTHKHEPQSVIVANQLNPPPSPPPSGDHTKALIGQLIIFNQILGELRQDIREQVSLNPGQSETGFKEWWAGLTCVLRAGEGDGSYQEQHPGVSGVR